MFFRRRIGWFAAQARQLLPINPAQRKATAGVEIGDGFSERGP
jgi:hypothetical protein